MYIFIFLVLSFFSLSPAASIPFDHGATKCPRAAGLYPKYGSLCRSYYFCINWTPHEKTCPPGKHFHPVQEWCVPKNLYPCFEDPPSKICPRRNGLFVKKGSQCKEYYECIAGKAYKRKCPRFELFNPASDSCEWQETYECNEDGENPISTANPCYPCFTRRPVTKSSTMLSTSSKRSSLLSTTISKLQSTFSSSSVHPSSSLPTTKYPESTSTAPSTYDNKRLSTTFSSVAQTTSSKFLLSSTKQGNSPSITSSSFLSTTDNVILPLSTTSKSPPVTIHSSEPSTMMQTTTAFTKIKSWTTPKISTPHANGSSTILSYSTERPFTLYKTSHEDMPVNTKQISTTTSELLVTVPRGCEFGDPNCQPDPTLCPEQEGLFCHPDSPNLFIHCDYWKPYIKRCPENLHFNPDVKECLWPDENIKTGNKKCYY